MTPVVSRVSVDSPHFGRTAEALQSRKTRNFRRGLSRVSMVKWLVASIIVLSFLNPFFLHIQNSDDAYSAIGFGSFLAPLIILLSIRRIAALLSRCRHMRILVWFPICML